MARFSIWHDMTRHEQNTACLHLSLVRRKKADINLQCSSSNEEILVWYNSGSIFRSCHCCRLSVRHTPTGCWWVLHWTLKAKSRVIFLPPFIFNESEPEAGTRAVRRCERKCLSAAQCAPWKRKIQVFSSVFYTWMSDCSLLHVPLSNVNNKHNSSISGTVIVSWDFLSFFFSTLFSIWFTFRRVNQLKVTRGHLDHFLLQWASIQTYFYVFLNCNTCGLLTMSLVGNWGVKSWKVTDNSNI